MDLDSGSHWKKTWIRILDPTGKKGIRILNLTRKNGSGFWIPLEKMDPDSKQNCQIIFFFFAYFYAKIDKPFRDPEIFIISIFSTVQIWVFRVYINFRPLVVIFDGVSALISTEWWLIFYLFIYLVDILPLWSYENQIFNLYFNVQDIFNIYFLGRILSSILFC